MNSFNINYHLKAISPNIRGWGFSIWLSWAQYSPYQLFSVKYHFHTFIVNLSTSLCMLLLLSHISRVWLCATPLMASPPDSCPWDSPGKSIGVGCHCLLWSLCISSVFLRHRVLFNFSNQDYYSVWQYLYFQFSSLTQPCLTLWDPMDYSMPGLPVHHHLPQITQAHVHWVSDTI